MTPLSVFIGYDPREHEAYEVACRSILRHASVPVLITPLYLPHLRRVMNRFVRRNEDGKLWCPISDAPQSTEFAVSRFCVPSIHERGWALYLDCDVVCAADIKQLFDLADERYAVMVVKHDHIPAEASKMGGQEQTSYPRKNWSSVILWNCSHDAHHRLTSERLNFWPGRDLHAFKWLEDEEIGELPNEWNHLVGVDPKQEASIYHFTLGGPWIAGWPGGPQDDLWDREALELASAGEAATAKELLYAKP